MAKKRINKRNIKDWTWVKCHYVWRVEWCARIVLYEGTVIEDLWDDVKCKMMDRYIHVSDDLFEVTLPKKWVTIDY